MKTRPLFGGATLFEVCMEKVTFVLRNGKPRLMNRKLAEHLAALDKGSIYEPPEVTASDAVKEEAASLGISLTAVQGSGKDGRILKRDLQGYMTRMMKSE